MRATHALAAFLLVAAPARAAEPDGAALYAKHCARCHGAAGEGTKKYSSPLVGDRGAKDLAKVIADTMPEDKPGALTAAEAAAVAAFAHEAFYSPAARERNRPPRAEPLRLTATQHRNAVADLVASFRPPAEPPADARGLRGEYFPWHEDVVTGYYSDKDRAAARTESVLRFDWASANPVPDKIKTAGYSARWTGSVLVPHTGDYEFVVRSGNGVRLWVNAPPPPSGTNRGQNADPTPVPLIDAWVGTGAPTDHRGTVRLIGGRAYPIRLQWFKGKEAGAAVALRWKPPHGVEEDLPARVLSPALAPATLALRAHFPPDDRSLGWERGAGAPKEWARATADAALEAAGYVANHLYELSGTGPKDDPKAHLKRFAATFAERAFRRLLTADERGRYVDGLFDSAPDAVTGAKRAVAAALMAPAFLHREPPGTPDADAVASRLSFALWDSIPDAALLAAARAGKLGTRAEVRAHAERMLKDERARHKLRGFVHSWLRLDHAPELAKSAARFPGFGAPAAADLRTSLDLMIDDIVWGARSDFRELLLADRVPLNRRLAELYGAPPPAGDGFALVQLDAPHRAGVLTHPLVLASHAYAAESSPVHRGVWLARGAFGRALRPPAEAFTPFAADLHPKLNTRERVALQTKPAACMTCHGIINPLGFALEHFDAIGRFRTEDAGKPVDATGGYKPASGDAVPFAGARALAEYAANSADVHAALVEQLFRHLAQQPVRAYGPARADLTAKFVASKFHLRELVADAATTAALPPPAPK
jgi:mono/diheme cytochrome c family protein